MSAEAPVMSLDTPDTSPGFWSDLGKRLLRYQVSENSLESAALATRFANENRDLTLKNAKIGAWIVILLVPLCSLLDYFVYPTHFEQFLVLRLTCSLACLPLLFAINRRIGRRHYKVYPILLPVIPAGFISLMIYLSNDAASVYYAGLTLCIVGTSFVFSWTFREIGMTLAIILGVYFAATLPNLHSNDSVQKWGVFLNNTSFILLNSLILFASSLHHHRIRTREFLTRCTVENQREELRASNDELTEALQQLRQTEAQLIQSEKIASLDRLSAGIIHEINNPLNFAKAALFVLRKKARTLGEEQNETLNRIIQDVGEGIDRVASIVSDLRSFSHPDQSLGLVDVGQCVRKAVRMVRQEIEERDLTLEAVIPGDLTVTADENHLIQILINLVQNSIAALKDRPEPKIRISASRTPSRIEISVLDNGTGIKSEHLHRVFDPFFTTKDVGEGMGMGLNICYRMMKQMGGGIDVESDPGAYAKLTVWIPSQSVKPESPDAMMHQELHPAVLYVDDEPKARQYFLESFEDEFAVYTAANASEAMAILESRPSEIGVLISDQRMPGEKGVELLERARKLNPNLVRILVTAYSDYQTVVDAVNSGRVFRYLHKPWDPEELIGVIRHALGYYQALVEREHLLSLKAETIKQMQMADKVGSMGILAEGLNHHLRNALTAIRAFVDLSPATVDTTFQEQLNSDQNLWLEFRKHAQSQLDRIYSLLSHISQASPSRLSPRGDCLDVAEIITKVFSVFDHAYTEKRVEVFLDLDPTTPHIPVDIERFQQLWRLLFTEELTHLTPGDELVITVAPTHDRSGRSVLRICLRDNGDWPAEERYANLFDPFFVRTNKPDDFGVNMMACYSIVYLHGGTIEAKSGSLNGVEITMDFPLEAAETPNASDFFQSLLDHERRWKDRELELQSA